MMLKLKNLINRKFKQEDGLSLIEMAIGLVILGLIVTPLIQAYKVEEIRKSKVSTSGSLANTENAINQHYSNGNGYYPCPASLILEGGDTDFGKSGDCTLSNIKLCSNVLWRTSEGICKTDDTADSVIIGGIPFSKLIMKQENALDYWGNKIIYAVTFEQTNNITFAVNNGAVLVNAVDDPVLVQSGTEDGIPEEKSNTIDFFLFSTGSSAAGGFTKDGISTAACGLASDGFENENCDFDNRFFHDVNPSNNRASAFSQVTGAMFFDDITLAQESVPETTWFQHPDGFAITMATKIRIGLTDFSSSAIIEVDGDIRAEGRLQSDVICDAGMVCFDPELITGTIDEMRCDADNSLPGEQAVMRLANSQVYCGSAEDNQNTNTAIEGDLVQINTSVIRINSCPLGDLVSGIDPNGDIICITP